MRVLRFFVDMYGNKSYYDAISDYGASESEFWTVEVEVDSLGSGFEGKVYLLGVF